MYADGELKDVDVRDVLKLLLDAESEEILDRAVAKLRPLIWLRVLP